MAVYNYTALSAGEFNELKHKVAVINDRYQRVQQSNVKRGVEKWYKSRISHLETTNKGMISKAALSSKFKKGSLTKSEVTLIENMYSQNYTITKYKNELIKAAKDIEASGDFDGFSELSKEDKMLAVENYYADVHDIIENYSQAIYAVSELSDAVHRSSNLTPSEIKKIIDLSKNSESDEDIAMQHWKQREFEVYEEVNPFD